MVLVHELSWSVSRSATLAECPRRYYYSYYLSWRGWERDADARRRLAYRLKKLHSLATWAGDSLHQALADWFAARARGGAVPGPDEVREAALTRLRRGYAESRDRAADWERRPAKVTRLVEHYYREPSVDEASGEAGRYGRRFVERITSAVERFFGDPELARCRESDPDSWLACEELGTIDLFDTKVFAVPDFALRDGGEVWIYDWKTGRPRERDRFQLALYALYAEQVWDADPTAVRCVDAYLPSGELVEQTFDRGELAATLEQVAASIDEMRRLHFDADLEVGDPEAFPVLPEGDRTCASCSFRELCGR